MASGDINCLLKVLRNRSTLRQSLKKRQARFHPQRYGPCQQNPETIGITGNVRTLAAVPLNKASGGMPTMGKSPLLCGAPTWMDTKRCLSNATHKAEIT